MSNESTFWNILPENSTVAFKNFYESPRVSSLLDFNRNLMLT